jgi:uncharacterized PurR-regulated membrane protein YhhQ (DUF165 family)
MNQAIVVIWLAAIVAANLSIAQFGPSVSVLNAFFLIGLTLTTRDYLHKAWDGRNLKKKMFLLIAAGGVLSWLTQPAAGQIAVASVTAFAISEIIDSIIYHRTKSINKSNAVSGLVDSIVFPTLAFGGFPIWIILGQWAAKFFGGAVWAFLLRKKVWVMVISLFGVTTTQAQNLQLHQNEHGQYVTAEIFARGDVDVYAFFDKYFYGAEVVYGEICLYKTFGNVAVTVQTEMGRARFFDIPTVALIGARWKGFELLIRSDRSLQLTYVWFHRKGNWQFNGYMDVWGRDSWQMNSQPQLWYWVNNYIAFGSEVFVRADKDKVTATPSVSLKFNY